MHKFSSLGFYKIFNFYILIITLSCSTIETKKVEFDPPNILFVISDDQSFPHAGAYGTHWVRTPSFDKVANEGLLFFQAFTPNAKCAPSRACILTGRNSWELEEAANHVPFFPEKFKTFPEVLRENGYWVGRTGKGWAPGVAIKKGKSRELIGKDYNAYKLEPVTTGISNKDYADNFREFLEEKPKGQPFFFWFGAHEPHRSYEFQSGINKAGKRLEDIPEVPPFWPDNDTVRADMLDYALEIEHFDMQLGKMLTLLQQRGLLENTIVVVTSDNGMPFPRVKGQTFEYDNHLPLAIRWGKGIKNPGREVHEYVNFIDFAPTFLELAGIQKENSGMQPLSGQGLSSLFRDSISKNQREFVLIGKERHDVGRPHDQGYPVRGIVKGNYTYMVNFKPNLWPAGNPETGYLNTDGSPTKTVILNDRRTTGSSYYWNLCFGKRNEEELYNIKKDPFCMSNLITDSTLAKLKTELRSILFRELEKQGDPRVLGNGDIFDNYKYADENTRGFYERYMNGEKLKAGWVNEEDFEKRD